MYVHCLLYYCFKFSRLSASMKILYQYVKSKALKIASRYMKINNPSDIKVRERISTTELLIILNDTARTIIITGTPITTNEFIRNLHLIRACLNNHLKVSQMLEKARDILFITASQAEQSLNTI